MRRRMPGRAKASRSARWRFSEIPVRHSSASLSHQLPIRLLTKSRRINGKFFAFGYVSGRIHIVILVDYNIGRRGIVQIPAHRKAIKIERTSVPSVLDNAKVFIHLPQALRQVRNLSFINPSNFLIPVEKVGFFRDIAYRKYADTVDRGRL
jgi:hypothetical protein